MNGCPSWCSLGHEHDCDQHHLADLQTIYLQTIDGDTRLSAVFADLRQGPHDAHPAVHVNRDTEQILVVTPDDALRIGWTLVELGLMGGAR